ncbi:hypothetical protein Salat_1485200 [Sesamum alatum]|uniref:Uncharacterized protein n=1 Tax=Sesamum alatum TaxID=300844 RepID=A0AAE1YBN5_9LAMI|nr:hypothetical protein Salat_1485200 [Sesamum alatum]
MAVPRPGPVTPARAAPRKLEGRATSSRHCSAREQLEALPRAPAPARGRCLEPPALPGARGTTSSRRPADHPCTASSTSPRTRGSRHVPRAGVVRRLCPGLETVPRASSRTAQLELGRTTPARGASSWALFWLGGLITLS